MDPLSGLFLQLNLKKWDEHWQGGNNKYPPVTVMNLDALKPAVKLELLARILEERQKCCGFLKSACKYGPGAKDALLQARGAPAIFLPSGGKAKESGWFWSNWWWLQMAKLGVPVFFVVALEELDGYVDALGSNKLPIHVIGYEGFGIGCGRAVSVIHILKGSIQGIVTDDRTGSVDFDASGTGSGKPVEKLDELTAMIALSDGKGPICSVGFKYKCNILTIVRGDRPINYKNVGTYCFAPLFMSSKEDLTLSLVIDAYKTLMQGALEDDDLWQVLVHTDTNNPKYLNDPKKYVGAKEKALTGCLSSAFFRDSNGAVLNPKMWSAQYDFKNMWDMIKMQESAMFQLMEKLVEDARNDKELLPVFIDRIAVPYFWAYR